MDLQIGRSLINEDNIPHPEIMSPAHRGPLPPEEDERQQDEQGNQDRARIDHVTAKGRHLDSIVLCDAFDHEVWSVSNVRVRSHKYRTT